MSELRSAPVSPTAVVHGTAVLSSHAVISGCGLCGSRGRMSEPGSATSFNPMLLLVARKCRKCML